MVSVILSLFSKLLVNVSCNLHSVFRIVIKWTIQLKPKKKKLCWTSVHFGAVMTIVVKEH